MERITEMMERYVKQGKCAGMVTLVSIGGETVHNGLCGYMDIGSGTPVQEDTLFRIYSMTKPITSVALMMLLERGFLQLGHLHGDRRHI